MTRLLLLAVAGSLTLAAPPTPQDDALAFIKKLKGEVTVDDKRPGRPVVAVNL